MTQDKQTAFRLDKVIVVESHIKQRPIESGEFSLNIVPSGVLNKTKSIFTLSLNVNVKDENGSFDANVTLEGLFIFKQDDDELNLSNYFYVNAPAIMFPYVRSYIAALTSLSGIKTVNIPVMRFDCAEELKSHTTIVE